MAKGNAHQGSCSRNNLRKYNNKPNLQPLVGEIGWSHNLVIFSKCKEDAKMELYLTALNRHMKEEDKNDAIGIIICKNKDKTVVEYSLSSSNHPIGVSTYSTGAKLPKDYLKYLPDSEMISKKLEQVRLAFTNAYDSDQDD